MAKSPLQLGIGSIRDNSAFGGLASKAKNPITRDILEDLINTFLTIPYKPEDPKSWEFLERCWHLFKKDYKVGQVSNPGGTLCSHYPSIILIPEGERVGREDNGAFNAKSMDEVVRRSSSLTVQDTESVTKLRHRKSRRTI